MASGRRSRRIRPGPKRSALRRQRRPIESGVTIVNLASGEKRDYPRIRRFAFSGEDGDVDCAASAAASWCAGCDGAPGAPGAPGATGAAGAQVAAGADAPKGSDLILRELATGNELNVGNVSDFAFTRDGRYLALRHRRARQGGQRPSAPRHDDRHRRGARQRGSDVTSDRRGPTRATGSRCSRAATIARCATSATAVLGFTDVTATAPVKTVFDPATDATFPKEYDRQRQPRSAMDRGPAVARLRHPLSAQARRRRRDGDADAAGSAPREGEAAATAATPAANADEKVDLVLWHWQDGRLQSQQQVQEQRDRNFSYLAEYRLRPKKFIRLADDDVRTVTVAPKRSLGHWHGRPRVRADAAPAAASAIRTCTPSTWPPASASSRRSSVRWFHGPSPGRHVVPLLRGRPLSRVFDGDRPGAEHHARCADLVHRHRRRSQRRQSAGRRDWLGQRQQVGAAARQLGRVAGVDGRGRGGGQPDGQRAADAIRYQTRFALERAAGSRQGHRPDASRCTSAPTASGPRRPASRA